MNNIYFQRIFQFSLFFTLLLSFIIFFQTVILKDDRGSKKMFNTWQFPMLLALFLDTLYIY